MTQSIEHAPFRPPGHRFVVSMIVLAIAVFVISVSLLAYRWLVTTEPSCLLIVEGDASLTGAQVSVESLDLLQNQKGMIGEGDRFNHSFYLDPGSYTVHVTLSGTKVFPDSDITLRAGDAMRMDLAHQRRLFAPSATAP